MKMEKFSKLVPWNEEIQEKFGLKNEEKEKSPETNREIFWADTP